MNVVTGVLCIVSGMGMLMALWRGLSHAPQWHRIPLAVAGCGILAASAYILNRDTEEVGFFCALAVEHMGFIALAILQFVTHPPSN